MKKTLTFAMVLLFLLAANIAVWSSGNAPAAVAGEPVDMTITIRQQGFGEDTTATPTHKLWEKNWKAYMRQFGTEMEIEWDIPGDFYGTIPLIWPPGTTRTFWWYSVMLWTSEKRARY
jgi:hypothetical protein